MKKSFYIQKTHSKVFKIKTYTSIQLTEKDLNRIKKIQRGIPHLAPLIGTLHRTSYNSFTTKEAWIEGVNLYHAILLNIVTKKSIFERLHKIEEDWKHYRFIHGDISLKNFILNPRDESITAIDWAISLKSPLGTTECSSFLDAIPLKNLLSQKISFFLLRSAVQNHFSRNCHL